METNTTMNDKPRVLDIISWLFGVLIFAIGVVNTFWGNDPGFGIFIILLSSIYFPPLATIIKEKTGLSTHKFIKIGLGLFIIWAALGVGELFDKIELMMMDF